MVPLALTTLNLGHGKAKLNLIKEKKNNCELKQSSTIIILMKLKSGYPNVFKLENSKKYTCIYPYYFLGKQIIICITEVKILF